MGKFLVYESEWTYCKKLSHRLVQEEGILPSKKSWEKCEIIIWKNVWTGRPVASRLTHSGFNLM